MGRDGSIVMQIFKTKLDGSVIMYIGASWRILVIHPWEAAKGGLSKTAQMIEMPFGDTLLWVRRIVYYIIIIIYLLQ